MVQNNVVTLKDLTCSIMRELSHLCRASFQRSPSLLYRWQFSQSNCFSSWWRVWAGITMITDWLTERVWLTLLLRQTTGHMEQPRVQQQHRHPNNSQRTLTGRAFLSVTLTRVTVAWSEENIDWWTSLTLYIPWTLPGPLGSVKTAEILCRICLKDQI